jgi:hypothetical protein
MNGWVGRWVSVFGCRGKEVDSWIPEHRLCNGW